MTEQYDDDAIWHTYLSKKAFRQVTR